MLQEIQTAERCKSTFATLDPGFPALEQAADVGGVAQPDQDRQEGRQLGELPVIHQKQGEDRAGADGGDRVVRSAHYSSLR